GSDPSAFPGADVHVRVGLGLVSEFRLFAMAEQRSADRICRVTATGRLRSVLRLCAHLRPLPEWPLLCFLRPLPQVPPNAVRRFGGSIGARTSQLAPRNAVAQ